MPHGYHGKILHVDLNTGQIEVEQPGEEFYRRYMGGSAIGAFYALRDIPAGADPFGQENVIVFATSVVTGAPISGLSRITITAKSPLSEGIGDSQSGGFFPAEMKFSGFDALVVRGKSEKPVYLWLHDGEAELRSAEHLWGKVTGDVDSQLKQELNDEKIEVLQCGPAGEKLVRYASVMSMSNRANGRTGMGAVMGSKNLKAVVVRGKSRPSLADRKKVIELARWGASNLKESNVYGLSMLGTAGVVRSQNASGGLPTRNWSSGDFEGAASIEGQTMDKAIVIDNDTCYACTVRCKRVVENKDADLPVDALYGGPEYETICMVGSACGVDDIKAVAYVNQLCAMYGIDTISCGATIAWAMDCFEQGILTEADTGGIDLRFGSAEAMIQMVEAIVHREGFGALLGEGSMRAAAEVGNGAEALTVTAKKQEFPAHMPQVKPSLGLIYAVNPFGADHESSHHDPTYAAYPERMAEIGLTDPQPSEVMNEEKVKFALVTQYYNSCIDSLNACVFVYGPAFQLYSAGQLVEAVSAITGWDVTMEELLALGARRLNLLRAFNMREGFDRTHDVLPPKLGKPLAAGKSKGKFVPPEELEWSKDHYYEMAGWDVETGQPTRAKLEELELGWVADALGLS